MIKKIHEYMKETGMLNGCKRLIVGLSGGADSVCLLNILHNIITTNAYEIAVTAVHINHGIRGEEASYDEEFARQTAEKLGIEFVAEHIDVTGLARKMSISVEDAGRRARYAAFERAGGHDDYRIAVAHHADDLAETVLMNIMRGSGVSGAGGMSPVTGRVIRPLLCVRRADIEDYLNEQGIGYVTDSTNSDCAYTRNRIRNKLIPYMISEFNPNVVEAICSFASDVAAMNDCMDEMLDEMSRQYLEFRDTCGNSCGNAYDIRKNFEGDNKNASRILVIKNTDRLKCHSDYIISQFIYRTVKLMVKDGKDIYRTHIKAIVRLIDAQTSKKINLPKGLVAVKCYNSIELYYDVPPELRAVWVKDNEDKLAEGGALREQTECIRLDRDKVSGCQVNLKRSVYLNNGKSQAVRVSVTMRVDDVDEEKINIISKTKNNDYTKIFDYDKIKDSLYLRFKQKDDCIRIGGGKTKKLGRLFIDNKLPADKRSNILLLCDETSCIWAVGVRRSDEYMVDKDSKRILIVSVEENL